MRRGLYAGMALASILAVVGWMGCGGKTDSEHAAMSPTGADASGQDQQQSNDMMAMCPMGVAGTQVGYQETPEGAALKFTTQPAEVSELRRRVASMVSMVNMHHGQGSGDMHGSSQGMGGCGAGGGQGMMDGGSMAGCLMMTVPSTASSAEIEGGVQVVLRPINPAQLSQLRTETQAHATRMADGDCPMMKAGGDSSDTGSGGIGGGDHESHH